jgi:hypothetical protein
MADIKISAGFNLAASIAPVYGASSGVATQSSMSILPSASGSTAYMRPYLALCKGTVPVAHPANYTEQNANFLCQWYDGGNNNGTAFDLTTNVGDVTTIITRPVAAGAGGTATWFWLWSGPSFGYAANVAHSIIGTVGGPGSGADLIIPNTTVVAGLQYRITLPIKWPSEWTY